MIIRAIKQNLLEGLSHVMRAISGKNANPIFSCIHLIAKDNKLTMITTDNEIRTETKIPVAIEAEGETVIFAKNFYDLVRRLPDVPITMSSVSKDGKDKTYYLYNICDHEACYKEVGSQAVSYTTGVPAMIGAMLMIKGIWKGEGVFNIEEFDPDPFMEALNEWGLPWQEDHNPELVD